MSDVPPTTTATATTTSTTTAPKQSWLTQFTQSVAFDFAGLGLIGAGIYAELFTKDTAAAAGLLTAGGVYLGIKAPVSTS